MTANKPHLSDYIINTNWTEEQKDEYICTHFGEDSSAHHNAVVPPVYESSLHVFNTFETFLDVQKDELNNYVYLRGTNPTVEIAEKKLAALERGDLCKCFSSGMAAISTAILALVKTGDHVLCVGNLYDTTFKLLNYLQKFGVDFTITHSCDMNDIAAEVQSNTTVIFMESPTSLTFQLFDIPAIVDLAKQKNIYTVIDNTWSTPLYQKPLLFGIDVVVHSAAKYLGGHSDILGGAIIARQEVMERIFYNEFMLFGGVMHAHEAWLLIRGLRTLPVRMKQHQQSGTKIAHMLANHPAIKKVNYPGLPSHPHYELGKKQLCGYSGLLSFELQDDSFETVKRVINELKLFSIGFSFGSYESLVLSPNHGDNLDELKKYNIDPGLIRISVGLENVDMLIDDLTQALNKII